MKNYPEHKHPHGVENTEENPARLWACEECDCIFADEEIRRDITSAEWGHACKAKKCRRETRCESHLDPYLPELP